MFVFISAAYFFFFCSFLRRMFEIMFKFACDEPNSVVEFQWFVIRSKTWIMCTMYVCVVLSEKRKKKCVYCPILRTHSTLMWSTKMNINNLLRFEPQNNIWISHWRRAFRLFVSTYRQEVRRYTMPKPFGLWISSKTTV